MAVGARAWRFGASRAFWMSARTGQGLIAVQVPLGLCLVMIGGRSDVELQRLYGFGAPVGMVVTEVARVRAGDLAPERAGYCDRELHDERGPAMRPSPVALARRPRAAGGDHDRVGSGLRAGAGGRRDWRLR